ncbi:hypothetical protein ATERTT37_005631 [Aspergillus terreus]
MCPISVFSIFVALHNRDDGVIIETGKHEFLQFQFAVTGFMIVVGFLLLNVAVQYAGGYYVGSAGLALTATFVLMAVSCSIEDHLPPPAGANAAQNRQQGQRQDEPQLSLSQFLGLRKSSLLIPKGRLVLRWVIVGLVVLEVVGALLLLGLGIAQTRLASSTCRVL